jgi:hypothetical protein
MVLDDYCRARSRAERAHACRIVKEPDVVIADHMVDLCFHAAPSRNELTAMQVYRNESAAEL